MNFKQAFEAMKQGAKVKLPSWGGYWCWDAEKETIMMHCRPKDADEGQRTVLDIRETKRVEYTLANILSDEWIIADEGNTPVLGGEATFSFSEAIKYIKRGLKMTRKGWSGQGQYVRIILPGNACCDHYPMQPCLGLKTVNCEMQPGWVPSARDLLAEDWIFAE